MNKPVSDQYTLITRKIFNNSAVIFLGNVLRNIIAFVVSINLARYLGVSEFGVFSYIFTFIVLFDEFPKLGMDAILVREISHNRQNAQNLLGNALSLRVILFLIAMFLVCIIITFIKGFSRVSFLIYLASLSLFFSVQLLYENMFKVDLKMFYPMLATLAKAIIYGLLVFILIHSKSSIGSFVIASILSGFISLFILIQFSKRYFAINFKTDLKIWRMLVKESLPLLLSGIFTLIYMRIDIILLEAIKGFKAVGYYAAARKFLDVLLIIPVTVSISLFPLMSKFYKNDPAQFKRFCAFGLKYMLMLILPIILGTFFFAEKIILLYGKSYLPAAFSLKILIVSALFTFLNIILVNGLIAAGKQKIDAIASGIAMLVNIGTNLILIPLFSFNGASLTIVITEFLLFIIYLVCLSRRVGFVMTDVKIPHLVGANLILLIFLLLARPMPFIFALVFSVTIYMVLMITFNILKKDVGYFLGFSFK